eukprot:4155093-Amphidinium_carterae.1
MGGTCGLWPSRAEADFACARSMPCSLGCADWQVRGSQGSGRASRPCTPCSASKVSTHAQTIWETFRSFPRRMATHAHVSGMLKTFWSLVMWDQYSGLSHKHARQLGHCPKRAVVRNCPR